LRFERSRVGSSGGAAPNARVIAVGGGKGGVGKTFFVANVAAGIAKQGAEVVVVDGDLEGANLHTCLGVRAPRHSLADFVAQREIDLPKLLVETCVPGLRLIAGTHGNLSDAQPTHEERLRLLSRLRELPADLVMIDLGAGIHDSVMDYFLASDDGVVVLNPEPTAIENAYSFLRAAFYRRLRLAMVSHAVRALVTEAMDQRNERGIRTPLDLLREVQSRDPVEGGRFSEAIRRFRPRLVVNEVGSAGDIKLGFGVQSVCRKYFGIDAEYLGYVNHDPAVRDSVMARSPVVYAHPNSDAAIYLDRIARKLASEALPSRAVELDLKPGQDRT
jgi:flagellar biosynthesis protein FlhG